MDIDKLIKGCIANQRVSQKEFYLLTADRLMNISRRYTSNIHDAKDVLQNAYIQIFKKIKQFDAKKGNLDSWLTKIVINEALQLLRKKKTRTIKETNSQEQFEISTSPDILKRLQAEDVLRVLTRIPESYRIVFNMYVVEGYAHKEIAKLLTITESTSRSKLTRAKQMIRDLIVKQKKAESC